MCQIVQPGIQWPVRSAHRAPASIHNSGSREVATYAYCGYCNNRPGFDDVHVGGFNRSVRSVVRIGGSILDSGFSQVVNVMLRGLFGEVKRIDRVNVFATRWYVSAPSFTRTTSG